MSVFQERASLFSDEESVFNPQLEPRLENAGTEITAASLQSSAVQSPQRFRDRVSEFLGLSPRPASVPGGLGAETAAQTEETGETVECKPKPVASSESKYSFCHDKQTQLNTIRNEKIECAPLPVGVSELFLLRYPDQEDVFKNELELCKLSLKDFEIPSQWKVFRLRDSEMVLDRILRNSKDLKRMVSQHKAEFKAALRRAKPKIIAEAQGDNSRHNGLQISYLKNQYELTSAEMCNGMCLCFQVPQSKAFRFYQYAIKALVEEEFKSVPQSLRETKFKYLLIGLSFFIPAGSTGATQEQQDEPMLFKIWLPFLRHRGRRGFIVQALVAFLQSCTNHELDDCLLDCRLVDTASLAAVALHQLT